MQADAYSESSVTVLKGLEPVKERPGMYTHTDSPTHICQEVIDNAADEALAGFANTISVTLHQDGSMSVSDNGRGIPVGIHPTEGISVVELVFTRLHAGGKFHKTDSDAAYAFAGGLHGVGVSVTNALSTRLEVTVKRDGEIWHMAFADGFVVRPLERIGKTSHKDTGTTIRVWPNPKYFDSAHYAVTQLERMLRAKAVLLPGLQVELTQEKVDGSTHQQNWHYPDGMVGYLDEILGDSPIVVEPIALSHYMGKDSDFSTGEGAAVVITWLEEGNVNKESYVNLIPTAGGGTHEAGLKQALFTALNHFIQLHHLLPRGIKIQSDDVFSRAVFVLSARILDPQFQGQTKDKLISRDSMRLVTAALTDPLELWLNQHTDAAKKIADIVIAQAQTRMRSVRKINKRKASGVAVLPGKLTDCESEDIRENELFLVEGDSAGGSAKLARDRITQAILPLRGKVLNTYEVDNDRLFANAEIHDISVAIGVDPHRADDENVDLSGLRYGKIAILSDADVDGSHIQVLLLTLFYRHFPQLIQQGHIYIARPPLYRIDVAAAKKKPARKFYALDDDELNRIIERLNQEKLTSQHYSISRFKGLGEMNPDQLKDTTLNPDTRRLLQLQIPTDESELTAAIFNKLMGKKEATTRRQWMEEQGDLVEADI